MLRASLGANLAAWRGSGAGGWCLPSRNAKARDAQLAARQRLEAAGLLDVVPSMDEPPAEAGDCHDDNLPGNPGPCTPELAEAGVAVTGTP